jgi:hypothetical protein
MTDLLFIGWKRLRSFSTTRQLALALGFALAVGVPSLWFGGGVTLKTGGISSASGAVGCYTSGTTGELVADPVAGTAIIERSGPPDRSHLAERLDRPEIWMGSRGRRRVKRRRPPDGNACLPHGGLPLGWHISDVRRPDAPLTDSSGQRVKRISK